jgi:hypothetical protein
MVGDAMVAVPGTGITGAAMARDPLEAGSPWNVRCPIAVGGLAELRDSDRVDELG